MKPQLQDLLIRLFSLSELERFVATHFPAVVHAVSFGNAPVEVAFRLVEALDKRGLIDDTLFNALIAERSGRRADIERVRALGSEAGPPADTTPPHHFDDDELEAIFARVTGSEPLADLDALDAGIPDSVMRGVGSFDNERGRLLATLRHLNATPRLRDGSVPMATWLGNAAIMTSGTDEGPEFAALARRVRGNQRLVRALPDGPSPTPNAMLRTLEAKIGPRDVTVSALFLTRGAEVAASVAKILVPRVIGGVHQQGWNGQPDVVSGTAWMIGPNLAITNHHVINARDDERDEPDATPEDFEAQALAATLQFGYYERNAEVETASVVRLEASDPEHDFAILRLDTARKPLQLERAALTQTAGLLTRRVNLFQHPNGEPMRLGFRDNFVVSGDKRWLTYLTDTDVGSSGSPVCNDDWRVVALHRGSRTLDNVTVNLHGTRINIENYGVQVASILAFLKARPELVPLHDEIVAPPPA